MICKAFKLLKILRLKKISTLIRGANASVESKGLFQIFYFMVILVIYTHVIACIMWHMLKTE